MNKREFLEKVISADVSAEMTEYAEQQLLALDQRNANRKQVVSAKRKAENQPIIDKIIENVGEMPILASELASTIGVSTQKISALCRQLVEQELLKKIEIKVPKVGKRMGYVKA